LAILFAVGCSTYVPQSQVIAKKDLATYNPKNFSSTARMASQTDHKKVRGEDEWIIKAIWYEQNSDFKQSNFYYKKLYEVTHKDEYLLKELKTALYSGITSENIAKLEKYSLAHPKNIVAKRLLLSSYLYEKKYKEAKNASTQLLSKSTQAVDFELSANSYIFTKEYAQAIDLLTQAYDKTYNEDILLKITTILVNYMGNIENAVERLEKHRIQYECSEKICLQLINIYAQQGDALKLLSVYEALYDGTQKEVYAEKVIESYVYLKNYEGAIGFLKTKYKNNELLYSLYIDNHSYDKADELSKLLIVETKDPKWYAESAMALYESSDDKDNQEMLIEVQKRFELAIANGVKNTVYLNYYGYTLIDKNMDIDKGIEIVKKALDEQPDNSYYLDSLAWGYYKLGNCEKAFPLMKRVVEIEGLGENEIIEHWNAINQKCKK
jgi:tetratricopeptide (TPR) repeat protein